MKKLWAVVLLAAVLAAAPGTMAEQPGQISGIMSAGLSAPSGDANQAWNMGFHAMGGIGFQVAPSLQFVPKIEYHAMPFDLKGTEGLSGGTLHVLMVGGDMMVAPSIQSSSVRPLFLFGLGIGAAGVSDLKYGGQTVISFESETKIYYNLGAGLQFDAGERNTVFVAIKFVSVQTEGSAITFVPITLGASFF